MSKPPSGTYYIVNRVMSPAGQKLAITFNGQDQTATTTPLANAANQTWNIADFSDGRTQTVSPISASNLQAGMGSNVVKVIPAGGYVWTIRNTDNGYTIQDGGVTVFWGLSKAVTGEQVNIGQGNNNEKQNWIFIPASF